MINISTPCIGNEEKEAILDVLNSKILVSGPKVKEFEEKFAQFCGTKHAIAVNSGTAALHSSLYALGIGPGDEVITTPFTFVATANCIIMQGAKPVFADVKEDTFNLDPESVRRKISPRTKAIIPVNLYGQIYDYEAIKKIANEYDLFIVEDACQSINAELNNVKSGNFGNLATFSFYATKNMIAGEGGMVVTNDDKCAEFVRRFRHHGQSEQTRYEYYDLGYNYRMTDLLAAIGLEQLKKIDVLTDARIENAKILTTGLNLVDGVKVPFVKEGVKHAFHQYTIKVEPQIRDGLKRYLEEQGVCSGIYYPKPLHLHPAFAKYGYQKGDFPVAEKLSKQVISLPVHPGLSNEELKEIIQKIKNFEFR